MKSIDQFVRTCRCLVMSRSKGWPTQEIGQTDLGMIISLLLFSIGLQGMSQEARPVHRIDGSFVRDWLILGPFPSKSTEVDFLEEMGGEENVHPTEGDSVTAPDGTQLIWSRISSDYDLVDVETVLGYQPWSVAYLYCELETDQTFEGHLRMTDSRSTNWIGWINGDKIESTSLNGHDVSNIPHWHKAPLRQGRNACLIKIIAELQEATFSFQPLPPESNSIELKVNGVHGQPASDALIQVYENGHPTWFTRTDKDGLAQLCLFPIQNTTSIRVTSQNAGTWLINEDFESRRNRRINLELATSESISGTVTARDGSSLEAVVVQAISVDGGETANSLEHQQSANDSRSLAETKHSRNPDSPFAPNLTTASPSTRTETQIIQSDNWFTPSLLPLPPYSETVHSDSEGKFQFVNLMPGFYQLRCHTSSGFAKAVFPHEAKMPTTIEVKPGIPVSGISFEIANDKKGTWSNIVTRKGVTEQMAISVTKALDGTLLIGTNEGSIWSYDGAKFTGSLQTQANQVEMMVTAPSGRTWTATQFGTTSFLAGSPNSAIHPEQLKERQIRSLSILNDGAPLFGTRTGIVRYQHPRITNPMATEGLPVNSIYSVLEEATGDMWLGSILGLTHKYQDGVSVPFRNNPFTARAIQHIYQDPTGTIWFCVRESNFGGLFRFDGTNVSRLGVEDGLPNSSVMEIGATSDGILWVATSNGLSRFDGETFVNYTTADGLRSNFIHDMHIDTDDILWLANGGLISRFDPNSISGFDSRDGLQNPGNSTVPVLSLELDLEGGLWVGTEWGGLYHMLPNEQSLSSIVPDLYVRKLHQDSKGPLWLGTSEGVIQLNDGEIKQILSRQWIISMAIDDQGGLWFGNGWRGGGVSYYAPNTTTEITFNSSNGLPDDQVWALTAGPNQKMWVGTSQGARSIDLATMRLDDKRHPLPETSFFNIRKDDKLALWFASNEGLHHLQDSDLTTYDSSRELPDGVYWCSAKTSDGIVWIGSANHGLIGYDGIASTTIDKRDGLNGNNVFTLKSDKDDVLWLGFLEGGLSRYNRSKSQPTAHLTEIDIGEHILTDFSVPAIARTGDRLTIRYRAIDQKTHPDKRQFVYRLFDSSNNSISTSVTKETTFDWVPSEPGHYHFEVQAIDRDLNYSKAARVTIHAIYSWHANPWIITPGCIAAVGLLLWAVIGVRLFLSKRRETTRMEERARIARDLHDQMGAGLTHIAMLGEMLQTQKNQTTISESLVGSLTQSAYDLSRTMGQVIWSTDPTQDTLKGFVSYVTNYAEKFFEVDPIRIRFDMPSIVPHIMLPAPFRHELFMVVKEALTNVAKHSKATEIRIGLEHKKEILQLTIEDDGNGFPIENITPDQHGIENMKKRANDLGGSFELETSNNGTRIKVKISL